MRNVFFSYFTLAAVILGGSVSPARAQDAFYTFTSATDGISWPASPTGMLNYDSFWADDTLGGYNRFDNYTENNVFFDSQYQAAGNSSLIDGDAMWGNPIDNYGYASIDVDFGDDWDTMADTVAFDIALAMAGQDAPDYISIDFYDNFENYASGTFSLNEVFNAGGAFGGFNGYAGHVSVSAANLIGYDGPLAGITGMSINFSDIVTTGGTSEFAIDNFEVNGDVVDPGLDPENSEVVLSTSGIATNMVRNTYDFSFGYIDVENIGSGGTTYSMTLDPSSDPEFVVDTPATNQTIAGGVTITNGSDNIATISTTTLSGDYQASATLTNDLNPLDPDDQVTYDITIFDPPSTTDDSGATVQVDVDPVIYIENAAAGPHAGARRASVEVTNRSFPADGFSVDGLNIGDRSDAGETETATVMFDRYGRINGTYTGYFAVSVKMADPNRPYLNGAAPLPDITWSLAYDLGTISSDSASVSVSDPLGPSVVGVNDAATAATILDGQSNANQTVSMALTSDPGSNADLAGTPVDLMFSGGSAQDPYVLQFTYLDGNIPGGVSESDLKVLFYDTLAGEWAAAVDGNSGGSATFYNGSYNSYLMFVGGGVLDAGDLGVFGVDTFNNKAWAIIDHASIFAVGVLSSGSLPGDLNGDGFVGLDDLDIILSNWNQTVPPGNPLADVSGPGGTPDGYVGLDDLDVVLSNWNNGTPPSHLSNIPEPTTFALIGSGALLLLRRTH